MSPNLCRLSWLQDPAAVQLWALLCFLQVLKAREMQRGKESSPGKVSIAGGCMGPQELLPGAVGRLLVCVVLEPPWGLGSGQEASPAWGRAASGGFAWLALSLDIPSTGAPCSRGDPWRPWGPLGFGLALLCVSRRAPSGSGAQKRRERAAPAPGRSSPSAPSSGHRLPRDGPFHIRDH